MQTLNIQRTENDSNTIISELFLCIIPTHYIFIKTESETVIAHKQNNALIPYTR